MSIRRLPTAETQAVLWGLAGGVAAAIAPRILPLGVDALRSPGTLALLLLPILASLAHLEVVPSTRGRDVPEQMALDEASLVLLLLVLPTGLAWLLSLLGYALGAVLRRTPGIRLLFNIGQWSVSLGIAAVAFTALAGDTGAGLTGLRVLAVAVAVSTHALVNYLAVGAVVTRASGVSWEDRWRATLLPWGLGLVGNVLLGLAAAALWLQAPWLVAVAAGLALVLKEAYRSLVVANERTDQARMDRDRLNLIVSQTAGGIALLDHTGCVTVWNPAMERLTGVPAVEAAGRQVDDVLSGQLRPCDGTPVLGHGGEERPQEFVLRHRAGEERIVRVRHRIQRDRVGSLVDDVVQFQDVTSEREAARLKDDFLARVSHELRTPLTPIIGFGRLLEQRGEQLPPSMRAEFRTRIVRAGEQLERLVDTLLLVATGTDTSSGRSASQLVQEPLAPHVERAVALEREDHAGRRVEVRVLAEPLAVIEPEWAATVVRHLVRNALLYSGDDTAVVVEVGATDRRATVRVIDRGRGIPPSRISTIFDRFTRVEDPLRMETRGAGLGLFVANRLVSRMGGRIEVESILGEGSTFEVHLPLAATEPRALPGRAA